MSKNPLLKYQRLSPYKVYIVDTDTSEEAIFMNELFYKNEIGEVRSVQTNNSILDEYDEFDLPTIPSTNKILKQLKSDDIIYFMTDGQMELLDYPKNSKESDLYFCIITIPSDKKHIMNNFEFLICKFYDNKFHKYNEVEKKWENFNYISIYWSKLN